MKMLEVKNLSIAWEGEEVVHDVSFSLNFGAVLVIVGESGSGKSTILKALLGLPSEERTVTGGKILLDGDDLLMKNADERRALAGPVLSMIFQDAGASFCPVRRVGDELFESVHRHKGWSREDLLAHARPLLAKLHLDESVLNAYPFELSGGMSERVGILSALLMQPRVLLADEPTSALDSVTQVQVVRELLALCQENGTALVLVTHHMGVAYYMADEILVMQKGRVVEQGTSEAIFRAPRSAYTKELIAAVPRIGAGGGEAVG